MGPMKGEVAASPVDWVGPPDTGPGKARNAHVIRAALRAGQRGHGCEPGALGRWQMP